MTTLVKPLITVVMSVYNSGDFLEEAINSILNQTLGDFEFIMIDDASTDRSLAIMERFSRKDNRIKLIRHKHNKGLTKSLIEAIEQARGEYVARQDSDDISLPQRLEKQAGFLTHHPPYGAIGTSAEIIDENGITIKKALVPKSWILIKQMLKFGNCFLHGSMMIRKIDYIKMGGYRSIFNLSQDFDLWLRLSKFKKLKNLKETLYLWRKTKDNITSKRINEQFKVGALALYDCRSENCLHINEDLSIDDYISRLSDIERKLYYKCLRDLCLRHGATEVAKKYCSASVRDRIFIMAVEFIMKTIRLRRP